MQTEYSLILKSCRTVNTLYESVKPQYNSMGLKKRFGCFERFAAYRMSR
ncbi:MAG: hypothetical protein ACTTKC_08700 [Treponema sp.]